MGNLINLRYMTTQALEGASWSSSSAAPSVSSSARPCSKDGRYSHAGSSAARISLGDAAEKATAKRVVRVRCGAGKAKGSEPHVRRRSGRRRLGRVRVLLLEDAARAQYTKVPFARDESGRASRAARTVVVGEQAAGRGLRRRVTLAAGLTRRRGTAPRRGGESRRGALASRGEAFPRLWAHNRVTSARIVEEAPGQLGREDPSCPFCGLFGPTFGRLS